MFFFYCQIERLDDLRYSLQLATLASADEVSSTQTPSTAEPSPRQQRHRVPNINNDADEIETSPSITRRGAMSPSMASVTSGSTTASGVDGTHGMTWDYIADLNYDGQSLEKRKVRKINILFSSNPNIHKSLYGLCFWASDP